MSNLNKVASCIKKNTRLSKILLRFYRLTKYSDVFRKYFVRFPSNSWRTNEIQKTITKYIQNIRLSAITTYYLYIFMMTDYFKIQKALFVVLLTEFINKLSVITFFVYFSRRFSWKCSTRFLMMTFLICSTNEYLVKKAFL